jgi:hypothetical protein
VLYNDILPGRKQTDRKDLRRGKAGRQAKVRAAATGNLSGTLSAAAICPTPFQKEDNMKGKLIFKLATLSTILSFLLVVPVLGQTGQTNEELGKQLKDYKAQILKDVKIAPEKEKALMAVEDKYSLMRGEIVEKSKQAWDGLQAALAAPTPDDAKLKAAVAGYIDGQAKLYQSFRSQLEEELALMTPIQQGKYLIAMEKWRQQCMPKVCIPVTTK